MTEEQVTKALLLWLTERSWHIVCFDFPQSGTGRVLHPDNSVGEKNKNTIIPDIVAVKRDTCLFFENKDRFYLPDYEKVNDLIVNNQYTGAISLLLSNYKVDRIYYGIGLPTEKHKHQSRESAGLVDFILGVSADKSIVELHNPKGISF
ncbi:MAG: hypothetical protein ACI3W5_16280 [Faecousia sp.]